MEQIGGGKGDLQRPEACGAILEADVGRLGVRVGSGFKGVGVELDHCRGGLGRDGGGERERDGWKKVACGS